MKPTMPNVTIPRDSKEKIMSKNGTLMGGKDNKYLWRFGFLWGSKSHEIHKVYTPTFVWVLTTKKGKILETYICLYIDLPKNIKELLKGE